MWNPFKFRIDPIKDSDMPDLDMPSPDWIADHPKEKFTFDLWKLENRQFQLLFVYDQMMKHHRMYDPMLSEHSFPIATAFTASRNFSLWKKKLGQGSFPIPLLIPYTRVPRARIKGELHSVLSYRFSDLDNYKSNGVEFRRKRVKLLVPYVRQERGVGVNDEVFVQKVEAWMYYGRYTYWKEHIDAGYMFKPVSRYEPRMREADGIKMGGYYSFTPKEYSD